MAFWLSNLEKLSIKLPKIPKQGTLFSLLLVDKYLANLVSTTVYNIKEFSIDIIEIIQLNLKGENI